MRSLSRVKRCTHVGAGIELVDGAEQPPLQGIGLVTEDDTGEVQVALRR
jgi:hypothetical protein